MVRRRVPCDQCGDQAYHSQEASPQDRTASPQDDAQIFPVPHPTPSYWLSEPHAYANLRSTSCLLRECDVAIIGSGMAGVLTAYHILEKNPDLHVVLLDARALCSGATGRNGGHIKVQAATLAALPTDEERNAMQSFVGQTIRHVKTIVDKEGLTEYCEFELRHSFDVLCDIEAVGKVKSVYEESVKNGAEWTKEVSYLSKKMAERVTCVKGAEGGFSVQAASFWPYKFVAGVLAKLVERYGTDDEGGRRGRLNVQMNTPVTRISTSNPSPSDNNEISHLHTPRGTLSARNVVFATNAWTAGLLPSFTNTIKPRKGMASQYVRASPLPSLTKLTQQLTASYPPTQSTPTYQIPTTSTTPPPQPPTPQEQTTSTPAQTPASSSAAARGFSLPHPPYHSTTQLTSPQT